MELETRTTTNSGVAAGAPAITKRLWHILRLLYITLRDGISKRKLMLDLHLLLHRGKLAGKAITNLLSHHHHHPHSTTTHGGAPFSSFSCRFMDPNLSFYDPREVEFSCSNTPVKRKHHRHNHHHHHHHYNATDIAKVFEFLNEANDSLSTLPSPSPLWPFGKSPAGVRQLRVTDSPFPVREVDEADGRVDKAAEEFIKRFYEQLRSQPAATPEYGYYRRRTPLIGRA